MIIIIRRFANHQIHGKTYVFVILNFNHRDWLRVVTDFVVRLKQFVVFTDWKYR